MVNRQILVLRSHNIAVMCPRHDRFSISPYSSSSALLGLLVLMLGLICSQVCSIIAMWFEANLDILEEAFR